MFWCVIASLFDSYSMDSDNKFMFDQMMEENSNTNAADAITG
jgi:hypothetical protein